MNRLCLGVFAVLALVGAASCGVIGAPERASDTQNLNAVSDDISAVTMTQSDVMHAADPNLRTVYPRTYQLPEQ
jgi:hypothetical protein